MRRALSLALLPAFVLLAATLGPAPWVDDVYAATYTFKFAHAQPDSHPRHKSMVYFKERIESASKGQIKVELYAAGVLGKEPELMDMVKVGSIQGTRGALFERANKKYLLCTWILALERVPDQVATFLIGLDLPLWVVLLALDAIILVVGFFVDVAPAIILLTPVFMPALKALGVSPIQFGAILIVGMAIGLVTPPVGMCLNVASTITKLDIVTIFRASTPFLIANLIILLLVTFLPAVSLWLPSVVMGS